MAHVLFVANYIIEYADEIGAPVNNLKLQKLLYYAQSAVLMETGESLFEEKIEKWRLGPVIPEVYHEYKRFGARNILQSNIISSIIEFKESENFELDIISYNQNDIKHKEIIKKVVDNLKEYTPFELVDMTHKQTIWSDAKEAIENRQNEKYEVDEMIDYYKNNETEMVWL